MTSHAAVVARGMGTPCVAGAGELRIDYAAKTLTAGNTVLNEGDTITIDGSNGQVLKGEVPKIQPEMTGDFGKLMGWVDEIRTLKVRANAETPLDASTARNFGCEGIGLCRTEHMFFDPQADHPRPRDDRRQHRRANAAPRWTSCCPISATTSCSCSPSWPGCR